MLKQKSLRILIIDNDINRRRIHKNLLWEKPTTDYVFEEFDSISTGLLACNSQSFDCVLLDQDTAGCNCLDLINSISSKMDEMPTPVIVLFGAIDIAFVVQAMKNGAQDCLLKTEVGAKTLHEAISQAVIAAELMRSSKIKQDEYKRLAVTDDLTGLYSRRYLLEHLQQEQHRASRYKIPFCLMLVDLDHFKRVNDQYGHLAGDRVLKSFSNLLRKCTRQSDIVCRYGGEEFLIVLTNTLLNAAKVVAERIRMSTKTQTHCSAKRRRLSGHLQYRPNRI